ncbi:chemotaxis protein LafU [Shewanella sp. NFH-SH190041]|uniref:flagellar motor protein MotB n=1 Tax=Shewanella sp. NFH-SH190041 TaxID=2950245 RepID=UPI0021C492AD|nr:flagellar motor protein MotB [Shewanella sp. NFH-SH190041]BDM62700.1 chemotaxis protein LafU [Shewanella sp. NFH-SH190041]
MAPRNEPIIIKKRPRGKKHAAHGGAWKVAFADFTLAMMALFMVLWIMQVADPKERKIVVQYMNGGILSVGQMNPFDIANNPSLLDLEGHARATQTPSNTPQNGVARAGNSMFSQIPEGSQAAMAGQGTDLKTLIPGTFANQAQLEVLAKQINKAVKNAHMGANVSLQIVPQGIRIRIHDSKRKAMFKVGQAQMQPYFQDLLLALAPLLHQVKNQLIISGHTDALPYVGHRYSNWDLSAARALVARRTLQFGGVTSNQVLEVNGMADRVPAVPSAPDSPENRRIEILVLTKQASDQLSSMLSGSIVPKAEKIAAANQPIARYPQATSHLEL